MSIEGQVTTGGEEQVAPVVQEQVQVQPAAEPSVYSGLSRKFGWEAASEEEFVGNVSKLQSEYEQTRKEKEDLAASLKRLSPFLLHVNEELASSGFTGSDKEIAQKLQEKLSMSQMDYMEMAASSPLNVIAEGLLLDPAKYSREEATDLAEGIAYGIKQRVAEMYPDLGGDELEARIARNLTAEAKKYVPSLEERRPKIGLRPEGVKTPEQVAQEEKAAVEAATKRLYDAVTGFKQVEIGDVKWDVSITGEDGKIKQDMLPLIQTVADPDAFFTSMFCDDQKVYDPAKAMRVKYLMDNFHAIFAAREADARGGGAKTVEKQMMNIGGGLNSQNPSGGGAPRPRTMSEVVQGHSMGYQ